MRKSYEQPNLEIIEFDLCDFIMTSDGLTTTALLPDISTGVGDDDDLG